MTVDRHDRSGRRDYWRDHYDLRFIMERDWKRSPETARQDPYHERTMDNGYLNNAVYQMEEFLGKAVPSSESEIIYGERREHCFTATPIIRTTSAAARPSAVHAAMSRWIQRSAPAGADVKSWIY